jgi:phosphatidate cytidylyltransferase
VFDIRTDVLIALGGILAILVLASVMTFALRTTLKTDMHREIKARVQSWWVMVAIFAIAISVSDTVSLFFFALVSFLALKEYLSLIPTRRIDRQVIFWAYLAIPLQYLLIGIEWYGMFIILIPVYAFLLLPMRMVLAGETTNFLRAMGTLHWGLMAMVFSISHVAYLLVLPDEVNPGAGGAGLVNAGFESGLNGWERPSWLNSVIRSETSQVHSGTRSAALVGRVCSVGVRDHCLCSGIRSDLFGAGMDDRSDRRCVER